MIRIIKIAIRRFKRYFFRIFPSFRRFYIGISNIRRQEVSEYDKIISHVALYVKKGNAGDILLPVMVRDLIGYASGKPIKWEGIHAHQVVTKKSLNKINDSNGLVIGGGGLFLIDTNKNNLSGWQWSCSIKNLERITKPIAIFAVGYNRFRNQDEFKPIFKNFLKLLAEKSVFIGLRNFGSVDAIKGYLPEELRSKVIFQPCPTTVASKLYPELIQGFEVDRKPNVLALNYAHDRIDLRLGENRDEILNSLAKCMKQLSSEGMKIKVFVHMMTDELIIPFLEEAGVEHDVVYMNEISPEEVLKLYTQVSIAVGMRGHAQMIPFGCGTPIVSLISHDKLYWFLKDINRESWGIEMKSENFGENLYKLINETLQNRTELQKDILDIQNELLAVSTENVKKLMNEL